MDDNIRKRLLFLLTSIKEDWDFMKRITSCDKDSHYNNLLWEIFCTQLSSLTQQKTFLSTSDIDNLTRSYHIDDETLWQLLDTIRRQFQDNEEKVDNDTIILPIRIEQINPESKSLSSPDESTHEEIDKIETPHMTDVKNDSDSCSFSLEDYKFESKTELLDSDYDGESDEELKDGAIPNIDSAEDSNLVPSRTTYKKDSAGLSLSNSSCEESDADADMNIKSDFEITKERIKNEITRLEDKNLNEKKWQMKGEVEASERPINSLLEEVVDVDIAQRPAPVITEKTTLNLEDIIKLRLKNKTFDDVEKKDKPLQDVHEFKKKLVLNQEKSKMSLAEVYEKEYLSQVSGKTGETTSSSETLTPEQQEIKQKLDIIYKKLACLSNLHFTPKLPVPELVIVSGGSAKTLEEVGPSTTSEGNLLAPEEIAGSSKIMTKSKDERTSTDKKRERRKKKKFQARRSKNEENNSKKNPLTKGNKNLKTKATKLNDSKVRMTDFFTKLNELEARTTKTREDKNIKRKQGPSDSKIPSKKSN